MEAVTKNNQIPFSIRIESVGLKKNSFEILNNSKAKFEISLAIANYGFFLLLYTASATCSNTFAFIIGACFAVA